MTPQTSSREPRIDWSNSEVVWRLKGDLGEVYYKHLSDDRGFAYIKPDDIDMQSLIHRHRIEFKKGFNRLEVTIPKPLEDFLIDVAKPNSKYPSQRAYAFDFLSCYISPEEQSEILNDGTTIINGKDMADFNIIEIKTGTGTLSQNQRNLASECAERHVRHFIYRLLNADMPPNGWVFDIKTICSICNTEKPFKTFHPACQ